MQVKKEEQSEKKEQQQSLSTRTNLLDYDRKTDQEVIAVKQKEYIKENKSSFDMLIEQVRNRNNKKKAPSCLPLPPTLIGEEDVFGDESNDSFSILDDGQEEDNASVVNKSQEDLFNTCILYTSPSPRDS